MNHSLHYLYRQRFAKLTKKAFKLLLFVVYPLSGAVFFAMVCYSHTDAFILDLFALAMPLVLLTQPILFLGLAFRGSKKDKLHWFAFLLFFAASLKGWYVHMALACVNNNNHACKSFSVMSLNASTFNPLRNESYRSDSTVNIALYEWLRRNQAPDLLCLQEFFHGDDDDFDRTLDSIRINGQYDYYYVNPVFTQQFNGLVGITTFSRFPVLRSGNILFADGSINRGAWHDVLIGEDTLRLINFHLHSMSIRWKPLSNRCIHNVWLNLKQMVHSLYLGYNRRKDELKLIAPYLFSHIPNTILCADINTVPFSGTYKWLNRRLDNSNMRGNIGFGFTYQRFPWVVRIDHQFYGSNLEVLRFRRIRPWPFSDHFPIEAQYRFR